jgi:NADH-quinone oxidoreductase subunit J
MAAEFAAIIVRTPVLGRIHTIPADFGSVASLARALFTDYLVAFEVTSVLLLAAIVGAISLARRVAQPLVLVVPDPSRSTLATPPPAAPTVERKSA